MAKIWFGRMEIDDFVRNLNCLQFQGYAADSVDSKSVGKFKIYILCFGFLLYTTSSIATDSITTKLQIDRSPSLEGVERMNSTE